MINNRSDNYCIRNINLCKKEIRIKKNYIMFFYLLGCSSLYFFSDIIQKSNLISNYQKKKYVDCIKILTKYSHLVDQDIDSICQFFHNITNFNKFIQNLVFTWIISYCLMNKVMKTTFPFWYWIVAHFSILIFSLLGEVKELEFSIDSNENWDTTQISIVVFTGLSLISLIIRQIYVKAVRYKLLIIILLFNLFIYILFLANHKPIIYHLHHSFLCCFMSLFFSDFKSNFSLFCHAIMIGIMIQGINFFDIFGLIIFNTKNLANCPDIIFSILIFGVTTILSLIFGLLYKFYLVEEIEDNDENDFELSLLEI